MGVARPASSDETTCRCVFASATRPVLPRAYHNLHVLSQKCRRRIKMSPLCRLEMTLPRGFLGGVRGDGLADERRGADAARSAAGSGSKTIDDRGGGAVVEARA